MCKSSCEKLNNECPAVAFMRAHDVEIEKRHVIIAFEEVNDIIVSLHSGRVFSVFSI